MPHDKCVYTRYTFNVKLQDGGWHWHRVHCGQLGLYDLWGSPWSLRGWQWTQQELVVSLSLFLASKSEPERDRACPVLWLQGFRLLLKSLHSGTFSQASESKDCLVISDPAPPQPPLSPPNSADANGQPCYLSTTQGNITPLCLPSQTGSFPVVIPESNVFDTAIKFLLVSKNLNKNAASSSSFRLEMVSS